MARSIVSLIANTTVFADWLAHVAAFHHRSSAGLMLALEVLPWTNSKCLHFEIHLVPLSPKRFWPLPPAVSMHVEIARPKVSQLLDSLSASFANLGS